MKESAAHWAQPLDATRLDFFMANYACYHAARAARAIASMRGVTYRRQ